MYILFDNTYILLLSKFIDSFSIYVLTIRCLYGDYFHIHMKLYFDWIYGK